MDYSDMVNSGMPLIAHVIHRLTVGGLENGLVNLINNLPTNKYRHAIICLTEASDFSKRIKRNDVEIYQLHKKNGKDFHLYYRLWRLLRKLKPKIVHTRNLSALEGSVVACFSGVPIRIHGEHGRDIYDLHGGNTKYRALRRICSPFINCFITMSKDLENWLINDVGINRKKVTQLYNGVDTSRFKAKEYKVRSHLPDGFVDDNSIVIGTVGRLEPVKDQITLLKAFILVIEANPQYKQFLRLVLVGDGSDLTKIQSLLDENALKHLVWLAGNRDDVEQIIPEMDIFVLPSLGEGISNTILEAMASSLPVVATNVGGNVELVKHNETGMLVPANEPHAMAKVLQAYIDNPAKCILHGQNGRNRVEETFSLDAMMKRYQVIYDALLAGKSGKNTNKNKHL